MATRALKRSGRPSGPIGSCGGLGRSSGPLAAFATLAASAVLVASAATTAASTAPGTAAKVKCPIVASTGSLSPVEWAFTDSGAPSGRHPGVASSYTHGRGRWQSGRASGTVCHEDRLSVGKGSRDLVLAVSGAAKLSPGVTRVGLPGVELALKVKVAASDDPACPVGGAGTVMLFASYHETHRDTLTLRFSASCADHDHHYSGGSLHVLIARKGAQVNSA